MPPTALSTDLYELTMLAGYVAGGADARAAFELHIRHLPPRRAFLVAAGLDQALDYLERLRFTAEEIAYLRRVPALQGAPAAFFDEYLPRFRFTGDVWAMEEGTPVFPPEPLLRVTAPIGEAQIVETALLAIVAFQTSIASKAARVVEAAGGRPVVEFGTRRAHGTEAGLYAARAAFVGGCDGTSNVEAGRRFGIPVSGTMAHSWVLMHDDELDAFRRFADLYGERSVLLLDTYDTIEATRRFIAAGLRPGAVRLDSGDIVSSSRAVRRMLDEAGLTGTRIIVSSELDEDRIASLLAAGAPLDAFGVGTALSTSSDAPALSAIYKLVDVERDGVHTPTMKLSPEKRSEPGVKQVWRFEAGGVALRDLIGLADEDAPAGGMPLLKHVLRDGRRASPPPRVAELRDRSRLAVSRLPAGVRRLYEATSYPVDTSDALRTLASIVEQSIRHS